MTFTEVTGGYLVRLDKGEKLTEQLSAFAKAHNIAGAWISGIGGALGAELGFYNLDTKTYQWQAFAETMEITSLRGNIAWQKDEVALHLHATLSREDFSAIGGHVKELVVGGTCELLVTVLGDKPLQRQHDDEIDLNLLHL